MENIREFLKDRFLIELEDNDLSIKYVNKDNVLCNYSGLHAIQVIESIVETTKTKIKENGKPRESFLHATVSTKA